MIAQYTYGVQRFVRENREPFKHVVVVVMRDQGRSRAHEVDGGTHHYSIVVEFAYKNITDSREKKCKTL